MQQWWQEHRLRHIASREMSETRSVFMRRLLACRKRLELSSLCHGLRGFEPHIPLPWAWIAANVDVVPSRALEAWWYTRIWGQVPLLIAKLSQCPLCSECGSSHAPLTLEHLQADCAFILRWSQQNHMQPSLLTSWPLAPAQFVAAVRVFQDLLRAASDTETVIDIAVTHNAKRRRCNL